MIAHQSKHKPLHQIDIKFFVNMSGRGGHVDKRIAKAAAFKLCCQSASIPEAMRARKFSLAESSNPAKQMAVRRAYEKAIGGKTKATPATVLLLSADDRVAKNQINSQICWQANSGARDSGEAEGKADTTYGDRDAEMASE